MRIPEGWKLVECSLWTEGQIEAGVRNLECVSKIHSVEPRTVVMCVADAMIGAVPDVQLSDFESDSVRQRRDQDSREAAELQSWLVGNARTIRPVDGSGLFAWALVALRHQGELLLVPGASEEVEAHLERQAEILQIDLNAALSRETALRDEVGEAKGEYDRAANMLAALREELAELADLKAYATIPLRERCAERKDLQQRLADAERRNAELIELVEVMIEADKILTLWNSNDSAEVAENAYQEAFEKLKAALNKPEEAKSSANHVDCGSCPNITDGCLGACQRNKS